jgi:hypothetical protein
MYSREKQGDVPLSKYVPNLITRKVGELFSNVAQFFIRLLFKGTLCEADFYQLNPAFLMKKGEEFKKSFRFVQAALIT